MAEIDEFAAGLLEEAKRFLELAKEEGGDAEQPYLHAALMIGFAALEAEINSVGADAAIIKSLSVHDKAILLEKEVRLEDGRYVLKNALKMIRLEDRIMFLLATFTNKQIDKKSGWWPALQSATTLRNSLTHPKEKVVLKVAEVEMALEAIISTVDEVYKALYKKGFPAASRGLHSNLAF